MLIIIFNLFYINVQNINNILALEYDSHFLNSNNE